MKILASEVEQGQYVKYKNNLMQVTNASHNHLGRGGALLKITLQSLKTGGHQTASFRPQEQLEIADMEWLPTIVMDKDEDSISFEIDGDFETAPLTISPNHEFLDIGMKIQLGRFEDEYISVKLPHSHIYTIQSIDSDSTRARAKGNTNAKATLTSGASMKVPSFLKQGDRIEIGLRDFTYKKRAE